MPALVWDKLDDRIYEYGVDHAVLFVRDAQGAYPKGVAWSGLSNVSEKPSGGEPKPIYADNIKYANIRSKEEFAASIEAYTYPKEFEECDGTASIAPGVTITQQKRKTFGISYRTAVGSDADENLGYKLHLIYGCSAAPSEKPRSTVGEDIEPLKFTWEVTTTPVPVADAKPTSHLIIDSRTIDSGKMAEIEAILYGGMSEARMPLPDEIATLMTHTA